MSKFANGIRSGVRVKQGQTIDTLAQQENLRPHLHYEVLINGKRVTSNLKFLQEKF